MSTIDSATSGISILAYSSNIISKNDTDSDDSLTLDELGVDEDTFDSIDTDSDGYATRNEIAEAINSKLSEYDEMPSLEEFSALLSDLGLDVTIPDTSSSSSASQILSTYDTDGDYSISSEEATSLSDDEFSALDSDSDGYISTEELISSLEELYGEETSSTSDTSDTAEVTDEEDEETTEETDESSDEEEEEDISLTSADIRTYTLQMLLEALSMADDDSDEVAMSNLEKFMELYNEEDENGVSTYLENLLDSSSTTSTYA